MRLLASARRKGTQALHVARPHPAAGRRLRGRPGRAAPDRAGREPGGVARGAARRGAGGRHLHQRGPDDHLRRAARSAREAGLHQRAHRLHGGHLGGRRRPVGVGAPVRAAGAAVPLAALDPARERRAPSAGSRTAGTRVVIVSRFLPGSRVAASSPPNAGRARQWFPAGPLAALVWTPCCWARPVAAPQIEQGSQPALQLGAWRFVAPASPSSCSSRAARAGGWRSRRRGARNGAPAALGVLAAVALYAPCLPWYALLARGTARSRCPPPRTPAREAGSSASGARSCRRSSGRRAQASSRTRRLPRQAGGAPRRRAAEGWPEGARVDGARDSTSAGAQADVGQRGGGAAPRAHRGRARHLRT
jgi:hypothetical protein